MAVSKKTALILLCILSVATYASAAITCSDVASGLSPCIAFAKGPGGTPPAPCCGGIKSLVGKANSTPDRQTACRCLKTLASKVPGVNMGTVSKIPSQCGVSIPYKISLSTNCDTVK